MDEFKYFESIVREKENTAALIKLEKELEKNDFEMLMKYLKLDSRLSFFKDGEKSEIIELRKFVNEECCTIKKLDLCS